MDEEIIVLEEETEVVEEIEMEEATNFVTVGIKHSALEDRHDADQHLITSITGLSEKLDSIESLKPVRSNFGGHADYYLWGDTEDIGPGYFVRLGEDGMIHKCTNETTILRPKDLPLDATESGEVIIYALAGNITTADINKYYVVGTEAPYDIYAYDGIEYVQRSAYSYDGNQVIKTCHTTDILGVTVSAAGFIGNDENIVDTYTSAKATNINYALVATTGVVDVLCGHDIIIGDYVFPTVNGWAAKSTGSYGYLVTALVQNGEVVQDVNKEELLYARIVLSQSMVNTKKVSDNVDYLLGETKRLDENITTFGNTAEAALKRAEELAESAQNSANTSGQNAQDATNAAVNAQNSATNAWNAAEQAAPIAQAAKEDAKAAQEAALTLKNEAIAEANELATQIATDKSNETLNTVKALEYRLDEYTVGQYSQAYGLTFDQAKAILPVGTTFIPMDEDPTATGSRQEYKEVYAGEETDTEQTFAVGYAYVWTDNGWLVDKTVLTTRTPTTQTEGDYWFVVKEYDGEEYKCGSLYRWESGAWKEVAIRKENVMNRTMAHLYHENDTLRMSVNSVEGAVSAVETKVAETEGRIESQVGLVASVPAGIQAVPGNYNAETEIIDIIVDKTALDTNWLDKATVGKYYVVGSKLPYTVYECIEDAETKTKSFEPKDTVTYDGVNLYKINSSHIIAAANEDGSSMSLKADLINFNGSSVFLNALGDELGPNGSTVIDGSHITTGTIDASKAHITNLDASEIKAGKISADVMSVSEILGVINSDEETDLKIKADRLTLDGVNISLAAKTITINADDCLGIQSDNFSVDTQGNITANGGSIGGWDITTDGISKSFDDGDLYTVGLYTNNNSDQILSVKCNAIQYYAQLSYTSEEIKNDDGTSTIGYDNWVTIKTFSDSECTRPLPVREDITFDIIYWSDYDVNIQGWLSVTLFKGDYNTLYSVRALSETNERRYRFDYDDPGYLNDNLLSFTQKGGTFYVDKTGFLYAENADIQGNINATSGTIGLLSIEQNYVGTNNQTLQFTENGLVTQELEVTKSLTLDKILLNTISDKDNRPLLQCGEDAGYQSVTIGASYDYDTSKLTITTSPTLTRSVTVSITIRYVNAALDVNDVPYSIILPINHNTTTHSISKPATGRYTGASIKSITPNSIQQQSGQTGDTALYLLSNFYPKNDNTVQLGSADNRFSDIYANNMYVQSGETVTSDKNEKKNILSLSDQYSRFFDKLNPVSYKFIQNNSDRTHIGFIAQDVEQSLIDTGLTTKDFAGICYWDKEDGTKGYGLRYGEFIPLNTMEIQKLKKRVTELEDKLNKLITQQKD